MEDHAKPTLPQLTEADVRRIIAEVLKSINFAHTAVEFPELTKRLVGDIHAAVGGVYVPTPNERIVAALDAYPHKLITAQHLAERSGVDYKSRSPHSWAADLRGGGWVKLPSILQTKHGKSSAIYGRREFAPQLVMLGVVALRNEMPAEIMA